MVSSKRLYTFFFSAFNFFRDVANLFLFIKILDDEVECIKILILRAHCERIWAGGGGVVKSKNITNKRTVNKQKRCRLYSTTSPTNAHPSTI